MDNLLTLEFEAHHNEKNHHRCQEVFIVLLAMLNPITYFVGSSNF